MLHREHFQAVPDPACHPVSNQNSQKVPWKSALALCHQPNTEPWLQCLGKIPFLQTMLPGLVQIPFHPSQAEMTERRVYY